MKNIRNILLALIVLSHGATVRSMVDFGKASKSLFGEGADTSQIFTSVIDEKKKRLETVNKIRTNLQDAIQEFLQKGKVRLDEINNQIARIKLEVKQQPENYQLLDKKLENLNEQSSILNDISQAREYSLTIVDEERKVLEKFLQDPELTQYIKEYQENRPYTFEDLQKLNEKIFGFERTLIYLQDQEKNLLVEYENRKRSALDTSERYKKRQEALRSQESATGALEAEDFFGFDAQQRAELLGLEKQLFESKKQLNELRLQEIEYKLSLIRTKIFLTRLKLDALRMTIRRIKPLVKIREPEVLAAKAELVKNKQASFLTKESYRQEVEKIVADKERRIRVLSTLSKKYNIPLERELDEWTIEPRETVKSYVDISEVGDFNEFINLLDNKRKLFEAQIGLEDEKIDNETIETEVRETYYKITSRQFVSEEQIRKEVKQYDALRSKINASISRFKELKNAALDQQDIKKRASENIKTLKDSLQKQRTVLFNANPKEFARSLALLNDAEMRILQQIDGLSKIMSLYSDSINVAEGSLKHIEFIISELESITIWYRPEYAISWQGIQNIIPDIERFSREVYSYVTQLKTVDVGQGIVAFLMQPKKVVWFAFLLLALGFIFYLFSLALRFVQEFLISLGQDSVKTVGARALALFIVNFVRSYFVPLAIWVTLFVSVKLGLGPDRYLYIIFYLLSIPYLLYLAHCFIEEFVAFNRRYDHVLISHDYSRRFTLILSTLLYATITIVCFREALILGINHKSELPSILLAINFIIFQISLIFLIAKEQVLSIIPTRTNAWVWVYETVDQYYYFMLGLIIAIIVMSNPYVGFGRLVLFILRGLVLSALLIRFLFWAHEVLRKLLLQLFFSSDEEVVRERFAFAKTWYGLFVILAFFTVAALGVFIGARIWGWSLSVKEVSEWLDTPLIYLGHEVRPVTFFSVIRILFFLFSGFALAILVNRFVLRKIFDLLLIESGVQNTVTSLTRYFIVITSIMLGFANVGLGSLVIYVMGALILGIGWVIKEPISDFVSYFIILIQRPVKIGDYVWMDEETMGVVRKITPRAVIIRRRNSTTLVVPNTQVLNKPVTNWNYVQGFIAFDDIVITVGYKEDPEKVRNIFLQVLDRHPNILKSPRPIVRLENFTDAGFQFMIRGFLSSSYTLDQWDIASDIRLTMVKELRKNNVEIAVPMRVIVSSGRNVRDGDDAPTMPRG